MDTIQKTLFIGKNFLHFSQLASTNDQATLLLSKNKPSDGTVISTYRQVQGKGQSGSNWESEPDKNISLSFILYPQFLEARHQFLLNQAISLGVADFVAKYIEPKVKIKWSNDIYINDKKVVGILIQNTLIAQKIQSSVIGIGININQTEFKSDAPNPTSFKLETGKDYNLDELVEMLCWFIEIRYLQLKAGAYQKIKADYLGRLYRYMEDALYQKEGQPVFQGRIIGIADSGKLLLSTQQGTEAFDTKEVKFIL